MDIKQTLKDNKITQEEFADHIDLSRTALNLNLNGGEQKKPMIDCLNLLLAEKKGVTINIDHDKELIEISIDLSKYSR